MWTNEKAYALRTCNGVASMSFTKDDFKCVHGFGHV